MRVLHVIHSISREGGGPSRSSQGLVAGLCAVGVEAWLMTLDRGEKPWISGAEKFVNGGAFETALAQVGPDIVHLHGIWQYGLHRCAVICRRKRIPYVIAPRGMLEPWSLKTKWFKKMIARFLYQDYDLKNAAALHATAISEAEQFRRLGFTNPVIISPNGVNMPPREMRRKDECKQSRIEESVDAHVERGNSRKRFAEEKVAEWLDGVTEESFRTALEKLVAQKTTTKEYQFKRSEDRALAITEAEQFFAEFSRKIVELSDGRCVYFAPDPRAKMRNDDNAVSWAEYAFHAVSNGGNRIVGKDYHERWYNPHKASAFQSIESTLRDERCFVRLSNVDTRFDAIVFAGMENAKWMVQVVTRLDTMGNMDANLSEVTSTTSSKRQKKLPRMVPLSGAVQTVVHHQNTAGSYPSDGRIISNSNESCKGGSVRRALFVSRMHTKKGVLELIEAWARVKPHDWQCELVYTLNDEEERSYEGQVKKKIVELGMSYGTEVTSNADFILTGPLNDDAKWAAYARANFFVLPTYSENFGIVVAEALWAGVPVITTKGTPWQELEECRCGWWIDLPPKASLDVALREAMALPQESLRAMGARGRKLVEDKYTWKAVCDAMVDGYRRIVAEDGVAV